jgi:hypothetical protein
MTALRIARLRRLCGVSGALAALLAPLIYGEGHD